ncbi:hypothetical protein L7F22_005419 [Adiantum nelumboides]|nr:hypothetical protein [Adiantum nelumboides]
MLRIVRALSKNGGNQVQLDNASCLSFLWSQEAEKLMAAVVLPRYLAFQGDNDKLLMTSPTGKTPMLEFSADTEFLQHKAMVHEMHMVDAKTGTVAIRYVGNGKFWQVSDNNPYHQDVVMANREGGVPTSSDRTALFTLVQLNKQTVALKSEATGRYCVRRAYSFLLPNGGSGDSNARMVVKDPVLSRQLNDIVYDIGKAKIYNRRLIALVSQTATNHSSLPGQVTLQLSYTKSSTSSWNNSITTQLSATLKMMAGAPLVTEGGVEISASVSHAFSWGKETTDSLTVSPSYTVPNVPPGATVKVTVYAEQANCNVPFSYTQLDTLPEVGVQRTCFSDGIFVGANMFNFYIEAKDVHTNHLLHRANANALTPARIAQHN